MVTARAGCGRGRTHKSARGRFAPAGGGYGRDWPALGGLAVGARADPRTTRDVDVVVAVATDAEAEELVHFLHGYGYRVWAVVEHDVAGRLATARLSAPQGAGDGIIVDLLFASSGIEREVAFAAEEIELVPQLTVPVARIGHLLALKVLARDDRTRPQDWDDIRALLREATAPDLHEARAALKLIAERGFQRGKCLAHELDELIDQFANE